MLIELAVVIIVIFFMWKSRTTIPVVTQPVVTTPVVTAPIVNVPVVTQPVVTVPVVTPPVQRCVGGVYCDGSFVPDEVSVVGGAAVCGGESYQYNCIINAAGNPQWHTNGVACSPGMTGACPAPV